MTSDKYIVENILDEMDGQVLDYITEEGFYPPSDNRFLESYIRDIDGGDNFADYCECLFEMLEEEGHYD